MRVHAGRYGFRDVRGSGEVMRDNDELREGPVSAEEVEEYLAELRGPFTVEPMRRRAENRWGPGTRC